MEPDYPDISKFKGMKYRMLVNGEAHWYSIFQAGVVFDSNWCRVEIGGTVLEPDSEVERPITAKERSIISEIADEYSGSK